MLALVRDLHGLLMVALLFACGGGSAQAEHSQSEATSRGEGASQEGNKDRPPQSLTEIESQVAAWARQWLATERVPGFVVGTLQADGEARFLGFGKTSSDGARPTRRTLFEVGGLTQIFTGLLLADAEVRRYVRGSDSLAETIAGLRMPNGMHEKIRLRQLAAHSAGLPRLPSDVVVSDDGTRDPFAGYTHEQLISTLRSTEAPGIPGAQYYPSELGFAALGLALERRLKLPFEELLRERLIIPMKLRGLHVGSNTPVAQPHDAGEPTPAWSWDAFAPAGAIRSDAESLMRFALFQISDKRHSWKFAIEKSHQVVYPPTSKPAVGSTYGWNVRGSLLWQIGLTQGSAAAFIINLEHRHAVVVLANGDDLHHTQHLAETLNDILSGRVANFVVDPNAEHTEPLAIAPFPEPDPEVVAAQALADARRSEAEAADEAPYIRARVLRTRGMRALRAKKFKEAERLFRESLENFYGSSKSMHGLGEALLELGKKRKAIKWLKKALDRNPANQSIRRLLDQARR